MGALISVMVLLIMGTAVYIPFFLMYLSFKARKPQERVSIPKKSGSSMMRNTLNDLSVLFGQHAKLGRDSMQPQIRALINSLLDLEKALQKSQATPAQIALVEETHLQNVQKLIQSMGEDTYISMVRTPQYWHKVDQKELIRKAADVTKSKIDESISRIYGTMSLDSKVNLETIIGSESPTVRDIYRRYEDEE